MRVYVVHIASPALLYRSFERVMDAVEVASCALDLRERRLRFLAPTKVGDALVEALYLEGGMTWCTRHDVVAVLRLPTSGVVEELAPAAV